MANPGDYGVLAPIVADAGSVMAAGVALVLAFRGRSRWEPSEQDVPNGGQRVAALVAIVIVVLVWLQYRSPDNAGGLNVIVITSACLATVSFLVYSFLVGSHTYKLYEGVKGAEMRIIGGLRLTDEAEKARRKHKVGEQRLLQGLAYDPDRVWTRGSRAMIKTVVAAAYMLFLAGGAIALGSTAVRLSLAFQA